jgi:RHS repeat-associated protein
MINAGPNGIHSYCHDGNGNVMALVNSSDGVSSAEFDYSPFGQTLRATGPMALNNPLGFSGQYRDNVTRHILYLYRSYNPDTGGWECRDPIAESGGPALYGFLRNHPMNSVDVLGFYEEDGHFYATYMGAVAAGYSRDNAFQLAFYSQLPDEVAFLSAFDTVGGHVHSRLYDEQWLKDVQQLLHSLHGGDVAKRRGCLANLLKDPSLAIWERGLLVHAFGDSYAHTYQAGRAHKDFAYRYPYGHASTGDGGHAPDIIANRPKLFQQYSRHLFDALNTGSGDIKKLRPLLQTAERLPKNELLRYEWMRRLAERRFGYNFSYQPELGILNDNNNPTKFDQSLHIPTRDEVRKLLDKIKCCK